MANVTKINLDGTAYDIADTSARSTAKAVTVKYNSGETSIVVTTGIDLS